MLVRARKAAIGFYLLSVLIFKTFRSSPIRSRIIRSATKRSIGPMPIPTRPIRPSKSAA